MIDLRIKWTGREGEGGAGSRRRGRGGDEILVLCFDDDVPALV